MSPLGVPARQSTNPPVIQSQSLESAPVTRKISPPAIQSQSLKSARVIQKTAHTRTRARVRLHTSVAIIPARRAARVQRARQSLDGTMYIRLRAQPDDEVVIKVRIEKL